MVSNQIGGILRDRYRLEEVVGEGAMGVVMRAHDEVLNRTVAIKLLKEEFAGDGATVERFRREALVAASLQHPGIAQVFDFGEQGGRSFIVMEFLEGQDLHTLLASSPQFTEPAATEIVARAAEALGHAHHAGAVHRDVKPGNIFITRFKQVKVTDFGIARAADLAPVTRTGSFVGTFKYMSPEQALGKPVSAASDVYGLGCVLFELLTGVPPFDEDSLPALAMAHVSDTAPSVQGLNPAVGERVDAIVSRCLAKNPRDRYSSGEELAGALRKAVPGSSRTELDEELSSLAPASFARNEDSAATSVAGSGLEATRVLAPEDRRRKRSRAGRRLLKPVLAVTGIAAAIFGLVILAGRAGDGALLPDWSGMQIDAVKQEAGNLGLVIDEEPEYSEEPSDEVLRQQPGAGVRVERGSVVTLFVSRGPEPVLVPEVIGLSLNEAEERLERYGFGVQVLGESRDKNPEIADQDPDPGTFRPRGSIVSLTIASRQYKGRGNDD